MIFRVGVVFFLQRVFYDDGFRLPPKVLLALEHANQPGREEAARNAPCPGLLFVVVGRRDAATGDISQEPYGGVDDDVRHDTGNEAVGNRVCEGHDGDGEEGGDGIAHVLPVDVRNGRGHHGSDDDEDTASGPRRDGCEDGGKEDADEEADAGDDGCEASLATFGNASTGLDKGRDRRNAKESTDGDADGVDHVGYRGTLKILGDGVDEAGKASHTVQRTRAIKDVDIEESDEGKAKLAAVLGNVPFLHIERVLDAVEVDNLFKEVERVVANGRVGEIRDGRGSGPGDDADENDAENNGALDTVHHKKHGQDATAENTNPHGWKAHLVPARASTVFEQIARRAAGKLKRRVGGTGNDAKTLAVGETNERQEEANAHASRQLDGMGDSAGKPLSHTKDGKAQEDEALDEDGSQGDSIRDWTGSVKANCTGS